MKYTSYLIALFLPLGGILGYLITPSKKTQVKQQSVELQEVDANNYVIKKFDNSIQATDIYEVAINGQKYIVVSRSSGGLAICPATK